MSASCSTLWRRPDLVGVAPRGNRAVLTYLGPAGTFAEKALRSLPESAEADLVPAATAREALASVAAGVADGAMLPAHNTVAGLVPDTMAALLGNVSLRVRREAVLDIRFALLTAPGKRLSDVRTVTGHPHARAQARDWLAKYLPQASWIPADSNAVGAIRVRDGECDAALAGEFTAARYGLAVVASGIHAKEGAVTRFWLFTRTGADNVLPVTPMPSAENIWRTSLIGSMEARPNRMRPVLARIRGTAGLGAASFHLNKADRSGVLFLADLAGPPDHAATVQALESLRCLVPGLRSIGSYPSISMPAVPASPV